jgi:hypothetical protein
MTGHRGPSHPFSTVETSTGAPVDGGPPREQVGGQTLLAQLLQSVEKGAEPGLESLDNEVVPVLWALRDELPGVGGE